VVFWCATLPWIRPDAVAFGVILVTVMAWKRRSLPGRETVGLAVGIATWLAFNRLYFDTWLTQSIIAKSVALAGPRNPAAVLERMRDLFSWYTMPIKTKYLDDVRVAGWLIIWAVIGCAVLFRRTRRGLNLGTAALMMLALVSIPAAYAYGGVTAPWYLWPTTYFTGALIVFVGKAFLDGLGGWMRTAGTVLAGLVLVGLMATQWAYSLNWGAQESRYRRSVGEYVREVSGGEGSLMLEPIGYIPYFSGLYVHDEIGMASPAVSAYRRQFRDRWWIQYLKDFAPKYLVERDHILERKTIDGVTMSDEEWNWFQDHYRVIRSFRYDARALARSQWEESLLRLGWVGGYHVLVGR
jgi:hypothetical protein